MTALQDRLSIPTDARGLKAMICDVIRGRPSDEPAKVAEPTLMGRGLERC
jgi:hypothetical protein